MIHGLRTVIYPAQDLAKGKAWYSQAQGREPHFDQPFVAAVKDPFGNLFGVIENPHFDAKNVR